ncbi:MAG: AraC family transcriptional regulator [Planctomycetota bacterium]|nr:AraC family transcriptional regulator [Planctomycetota bacterium]
MKSHVQRIAHSRQSSFVYRVKADRRFARGWHSHPEYELTYIQRSRGRRLVGDSVDTYASGDLVLLGPDLPHTWLSEASPASGPGRRRGSVHRAIVVQFRASFLGEGFLDSPELERVRGLLARSSRGLEITGRTRDDVSGRLTAMRKLGRFDRLLEFLRLLDVLARGGRDVRPICGTTCSFSPDPSSQRRFDRVFAHLHERYTGRVAQPEVAGLLGMSPSGFSRFFRRTTGKTFVEYLSELRISHACSLLIETDLSVLEISLRSGFNNLSNFNRKFLALKGMTPTRYRSQFATAFD